METSRFPDSQIIAVLKQAEGGKPVPELCRFHRVFVYVWLSERKSPPLGEAGLNWFSASLALAKLTMPSQLMLPLAAAYAVTHTGSL